MGADFRKWLTSVTTSLRAVAGSEPSNDMPTTSATCSATDAADLSGRAEARWGEKQPAIVSPANCAALSASVGGTGRRDTAEIRWGDWYPASVVPAAL